MISKEKVIHIAKLARIKLKKEEIEKYQKDLSKILEFVEKLKEIEIKEINPMSHPLSISNVMREDKEKELIKINFQKLIELFPEKKGNYLKVKKVIEF